MFLNGRPVLGDFGFALEVKEGYAPRHIGTKCYMAPELTLENDTIEMKELYACDVYSFGVLLFEITMGYLPFNYPKISSKKYNYNSQWDEFWSR
jgi:serine/threonine protein kinase